MIQNISFEKDGFLYVDDQKFSPKKISNFHLVKKDDVVDVEIVLIEKSKYWYSNKTLNRVGLGKLHISSDVYKHLKTVVNNIIPVIEF